LGCKIRLSSETQLLQLILSFTIPFHSIFEDQSLHFKAIQFLSSPLSVQDISTCNLGPLLPGLESSLDELFPLLTLEVPAGVSSMAYTQYLIDGSHHLFLGTRAGKLYQVNVLSE